MDNIQAIAFLQVLHTLNTMQYYARLRIDNVHLDKEFIIFEICQKNDIGIREQFRIDKTGEISVKAKNLDSVWATLDDDAFKRKKVL